jgi:hypothetical protein
VRTPFLLFEDRDAGPHIAAYSSEAAPGMDLAGLG